MPEPVALHVIECDFADELGLNGNPRGVPRPGPTAESPWTSSLTEARPPFDRFQFLQQFDALLRPKRRSVSDVMKRFALVQAEQ